MDFFGRLNLKKKSAFSVSKSPDVQEVLLFHKHEVLWKKRIGKKNLTLRIEPASTDQLYIVSVTSSMRTPKAEVVRFLMAKKIWIEKTTEKIQSSQQRFALKSILSGESFPLLGYQLKLSLAYMSNRRTVEFKKNFKEQALQCVSSIQDWSTPEAQKIFFTALQKFYMNNAKAYLTIRLEELSKITQLKYQRISIRNQRSRWGSCSSQGTISLNYKMIALSPSLIDYILIHELCHTQHMNHSDKFWSLVESFFPSYLDAEKLLKEQQYITHFLTQKF